MGWFETVTGKKILTDRSSLVACKSGLQKVLIRLEPVAGRMDAMRIAEQEKPTKNASGSCQCSGCGKPSTRLYQNNLCRDCLVEKFKTIRGFIDENRSRIFEATSVGIRA